MRLVVIFLFTHFGLQQIIAQEYKFAAGFRGGTYETISRSLNGLDGLQIKSLVTKGSVDNIEFIEQEKADLGLAQMDILANTLQYSQKAREKVALLMPVYSEEVHILSNGTVNSIDELKGKKLSIGAPRSGTKGTARIILGALGLDDTRVIVDQSTTKEGLAKLTGKKVDVLFIVSGSPVDLLWQLAPNQNLNFVNFNGPTFELLTSGYFPYKKATLPLATYRWQKKSAATISVFSSIIVKRKMANQQVTKLLSLIYGGKATLVAKHNKWQSLNRSIAVSFAKDAEQRKYFHHAALSFFGVK